MAEVLFIVGLVVSLVGGIMLLVKAFQTSVLWGLGSMFVPFVALIFVVKYWDDAKTPFLISLAGTAIYIGAGLAGSGGEMMGTAAGLG